MGEVEKRVSPMGGERKGEGKEQLKQVLEAKLCVCGRLVGREAI